MVAGQWKRRCRNQSIAVDFQGPSASLRGVRKKIATYNLQLSTIRQAASSGWSSVPRGGIHAMSALAEIDVLWITAGLGCDGDTISMTAATQPSIEDVVLGSMPWIPKVRFHNPFLA